VLRGDVGEVRHFADHVIAERGVRHGRLVLVPVDEKTETHTHGDARATPHSHLHIRRVEFCCTAARNGHAHAWPHAPRLYVTCRVAARSRALRHI